MKRTVTLLLAVLLVVSLLPLGAAAANGEKLIAITYDDGPSQYTAQLLDGLKARGAKATFFIVGYQARRTIAADQAELGRRAEPAQPHGRDARQRHRL